MMATRRCTLRCARGHERIAKALIDGKYEGRGAEIDALDMAGWTPLMLASYNGNKGVVRLLLARRAKVATRTASGRTVLSLAQGHPACTAFLRTHGATD